MLVRKLFDMDIARMVVPHRLRKPTSRTQVRWLLTSELN